MVKVLIVLDGGYRFDEPAAIDDFTYTVLVDALVAAGMQVTKAHRGTDGTADIESFNFLTSVNLLDFDVIWLIGHSGRNSSSSTGTSNFGVPEEQVAELARFMAAGGGVFATGDHDSIGAELSGHVPRVRAMRAWYGVNDSASPMPGSFPRNFPSLSSNRADTTRRNPAGDYGGDASLVWFENQSDSIPQAIVPSTSPAHPILRRAGNDILVFPDHMHEGKLFGEVMGYDYTQSVSLDTDSFVEFPEVAGHRELPVIIATGESLEHHTRYAHNDTVLDAAIAGAKPVPTLNVYEGRTCGVGRIVTGATFHHYVDINLTGDSALVTDTQLDRPGHDAAKGEGFDFAGAESTFADIKAVFVNITNWLARPRPRISIVLERSTFSQDEAGADPDFDNVILVHVDGLKPSQFPGGPIDDLTPSAMDLGAWAPQLSFAEPAGLSIVAIGIDSDDPSLPDRLQRFTFYYRLTIAAGAFGFAEDFNTVQVNATLNSAFVSAPLTDSAWIQLVKSANPFMLDLHNNDTAWLSSDLKIFPVVAGASKNGVTLPANANRTQALDFLREYISELSVGEFEALESSQAGSALSPYAQTTGGGAKNVYNFAIARVRLSPAGGSATDVRVFFRIFPAPTTAALTYHESMGVPLGSYKKTPGAEPIALPGTNGAGTQWVSFPVFSNSRAATPETQTDLDNVQTLDPGDDLFYGALIDNNLNAAYLPATPGGGGGAVSLPDLMMNEHQCIVAQIEYDLTPIPDGANPYTSDKLAQRNIAFSAIANPGLDASRMALHTFEIEATPHPISDVFPPDELLLQWGKGLPEGTELRLYIPGWSAAEVVALADRFYPRHEIRALDANTILMPGGGTRYVPIPPSHQRNTGVLIADFPLGVKQGQRFDLAVRQITNRGREVAPPPPKVTTVSKAEAAKLLAGAKRGAKAATAANQRGVFDLGGNRTLITDLRVIDAAPGDHALIVEQPAPEKVAAARRQSGRWRETIGAFQLGVPVSVKGEMLAHHIRLLSVLRWRAQFLRPNDRWYDTFRRYVELIAEKVRALGGDPFTVPATPDGNVDLPGGGGAGKEPGKDGELVPGDGGPGGGGDPFFEPGADDWLGDSNGLDAPGNAKPGLWSGKVSGLLFDHFGDFEGFLLESYAGGQQRFFSREAAIRDLAESAWIERHVVSVITVSAASRRVRRLLIRGYSG